MQVMDIKPAPKTNLEEWNYWKNHIKSILISNSPFAKKILIEDDPAETVDDILYGEKLMAKQDYLDSIEEDRYQQDHYEQ